jgi:hypothetical protein
MSKVQGLRSKVQDLRLKFQGSRFGLQCWNVNATVWVKCFRLKGFEFKGCELLRVWGSGRRRVKG